jgi:hypothetical protein
MRRRLPFALALLALAAAPAGPAFAWADTGHRLVATLAAEAFPAEIPAFLRSRQAVARLGEIAREPDRSKGAGQPHDADLDPAHFVDVDDAGKILGGPTLDALPANRQGYEQALQAAGADSWKAGWLPYSIVDGWQQLVKDFAYWRADRVGERSGATGRERAWFAEDRRLRELIILRDLGVFAHFVGDGAQPLHVTVHYNGWTDGPNPRGYTRERVHAPFEGAFVRDNASPAAVRRPMRPYAACACPVQASTVRFLQDSAAKVEPLYQLWGEGGFRGNDPRGRDFVVERLADGASQLRDMVVDAWRASAEASVGYPPVKVRTIEQSGRAPFDVIYGRE